MLISVFTNPSISPARNQEKMLSTHRTSLTVFPTVLGKAVARSFLLLSRLLIPFCHYLFIFSPGKDKKITVYWYRQNTRAHRKSPKAAAQPSETVRVERKVTALSSFAQNYSFLTQDAEYQNAEGGIRAGTRRVIPKPLTCKRS